MSSSAGAAERRREKPIPLLLGGYAALAETAWMGVAQATDVLGDGGRVLPVVRRAPHLGQQLGPGEHPPGRRRQHDQEVELPRGGLDHGPIEEHLPLRRTDLERSEGEDGGGGQMAEQLETGPVHAGLPPGMPHSTIGRVAFGREGNESGLSAL